MDYVEMIKDPDLICGFQELIEDSDPLVVKRTIKVFTSVYYHAIRLLTSEELDETTFLTAWPSVKGVVDTLMKMVADCENEGVLIQLVRFMEAAVTSHLMFDVTKFPEVFEKGRQVIKTGLRTLKNLVNTPYICGSSFIVAIRALITIACLRDDLLEPVTDLLKKQLSSLPPTLFDHNVRSLYITLQINLFRILRKAESPQLKEKLIEMMVFVGVPRKNILAWAPPPEAKKRPAIESISDETIMGRGTPPQKIARIDNEIPTDPRLRNSDVPSVSKDSSTVKSQNSSPTKSSSHFMFLSNLVPEVSLQSTSKETELYIKLDLKGVINLVIKGFSSNADLPESSNFIKLFKDECKVSNDIEEMRRHLSILLTKNLSDEHFKSLVEDAEKENQKPQHQNSFDTKEQKPQPKNSFDNREQKPQNQNHFDVIHKDTPNSSTSSTPSSTPPLMDTDLRQLYKHPKSLPPIDIDMRIPTRSLPTRDPRLMRDPRLLKDQNDHPRLPTSLQDSRHRSSPTLLKDPRLQQENISESSKPEPILGKSDNNNKQRKSRWDPRTSKELQESKKTQNTLDSQPTNNLQITPSLVPTVISPFTDSNNFVFTQSSVLLDPRFQTSPVISQTHAGQANVMPTFTNPYLLAAQMQNRLPFANPLIGGIHLPPNSIQQNPSNPIHAPLITHPPGTAVNPTPLGWISNPTVMVAQALSTSQAGILPTPLMNL